MARIDPPPPSHWFQYQCNCGVVWGVSDVRMIPPCPVHGYNRSPALHTYAPVQEDAEKARSEGYEDAYSNGWKDAIEHVKKRIGEL